ncbi:MAG: hypothetical protein K2M94_02865 [Paramuribaculum sp.]|nr:hypothetical protein [Paramuribaculum sp.]
MRKSILAFLCSLCFNVTIHADTINFVCDGYDTSDLHGTNIILSGSLYPEASPESTSIIEAPGICSISFSSSGVKEGLIVSAYANFQPGDVMTVRPYAGITITGLEMMVTTLTYAQSICHLAVDNDDDTVLPRVYDRPYLRTWNGNVTVGIQLSPESLIRFNYISINYRTSDASIYDTKEDCDNQPINFYTLQGIRISTNTNQPGIYIARQGTSTRKIIVRQ